MGSIWGPWRCGPGASPTRRQRFPPTCWETARPLRLEGPTRRQRFPFTCWETARLSLKTCHVSSQVDTPMAKGDESM